MKKRIQIVFILVLVGLVIISCDKDDVNSEVSPADISAIKAIVIKGDWRVTYYMDSGQDETADYDGYTFVFNAEGILNVTNGDTAISGAWTITDDSDSSSDDSSDDDIDFNIIFNSPDLFEELSDDWDIISYTESKIELKDVSGGDDSIDYLTLEKI